MINMISIKNCLIITSLLILMIMPIKAEEEYTIVRGDTLTKIAKEYDVTVQELMDANNLRSDLIFIGQKLVIPSEVSQVSKQLEMEEVEKPITPEEIKEPPVKPAPPSIKVEKETMVKEEPSPEVEVPDVKTETPEVKKKVATVRTGDVDFKWAFVARIDPQGRNKVVNIAADILNPGAKKFTITSGDKISMYVEPNENTCVYIYLIDSRKNLELLFPTSMDEDTIKSEFVTGKGTYIPGKFEWFSFDDNKGTEKFYIIGTNKRDKELEELTQVYINSEDNREIAKQQILDKIKGMKKQFAFKSNPVERPISFGGRIRGLEIDIAKLAVEVNANNMYTKTISLNHE